MNTDIDVTAIYFPSWHVNDHYQAWYGQGYSEWELIKNTQPVFPGHHQPKVPEWGYFDESDPAWSAKEIDLAADHGVTRFLFDWYWYSGVQIMEEALEKGFLQAPNRQRLKFSLMWANHNWGTFPAITGTPGLYQQVTDIEENWLPIHHELEDFDRVVDYCCEHYFSQPNYATVDGRPEFAFFDVWKLRDDLGGCSGARAGLERMAQRAETNGFPGIHFTANVGCVNDNVYCCGWDRVQDCHDMGFETVFAYNMVRTPAYDTLPDDMPVVEYDDVIESHKHCWGKIEANDCHHVPVVTFGCDVTPRWHRGVTMPYDFKSLNYEPIVVGNTPEKFGELCRLALAQAKPHGTLGRGIIINAWNEWSEGMYLLPEERYGTAYLQQLRDALTDLDTP
jgi:hypothetical protein